MATDATTSSSSDTGSDPGDPRRPYHHGNLRLELLAEAERALREQGVDKLSLRELARAVGVSHAAPRRHFPDRQALLDALAEQGFTRLRQELTRASESAGAGFADRARATAIAYVNFATEDAALLELMFAGKHRDPNGPLHDAAESAFGVMIGLIGEGQSQGTLREGETERVGMVMFAALQGIASLVNAGLIDPGLRDELVTEATARFLRA